MLYMVLFLLVNFVGETWSLGLTSEGTKVLTAQNRLKSLSPAAHLFRKRKKKTLPKIDVAPSTLFVVLFPIDSWEEPQDLSAKFGCSVSVGEHSFAQMEDDVDRQKLLGQPSHQRVGHPVTDIDHLTLQVQVNIFFFIANVRFKFCVFQQV
jgi:hypothetical protein